MANVKITALNVLSSAEIADEDVFVVVDIANDETKQIDFANIREALGATIGNAIVATANALAHANDFVTYTHLNSNINAVQSNVAAVQSTISAGFTVSSDTLTVQGGNVVPKANAVYSLGSPDALWNDLYLNNSSIYLGSIILSSVPEGLVITSNTGSQTVIYTPALGGAGNTSAKFASIDGRSANIESGLAGANLFIVALQGGIAGSNASIINLQSGLSGSNVRISGIEANVTALQNDGATNTNVRLSNLESNVSSLQGGVTGANASILVLQGGLAGSNTRISGTESNVIALQANSSGSPGDILNLQGGIAGANASIVNLQSGASGSNTRIAGAEGNVIALQSGLTGTNSTVATKDSIANVYITWNYLNANIISFASYANSAFTTNAHIDTKIAAVIDSSPEALNTLRELANALGNDSSFSTTVLNQIGTISANTVALQGGLTGANTAISTKDSIANVYATYLMSLGGLTGANTAILNLQTGLSGTNSTVATKDSIANVYATYLIAKGGIDSANTSIVNLQTGLTGSNTRITGAESNVISLQGGISGSNTSIVNLQGGLAGSNTNILNLQTGIAGANTNINNKANIASPVFTGNATFDTDVLFVDSLNDRVGISNTAPQHKLSVNGSIHIPRGDNDRIWSGPNNLRLGDYPQLQVSDTLLIFGGQQSISFGGTGNYATIGSNVPWDFMKTTTAQAIRIYGTYTDASNYERLLVSSNSTASYIQSQAVGTGTARDLYLGANNATVVTVAANGNVGIGNTSPSTKFHVTSGGNVLKFPQTDGGDVGLQIESGASGHAPSVHLKNAAGYFRLAVHSSDGSFRAYNGTDRLTILQNGNVGIGTSSPTSNLDVIGTANISSTITASGVNLLSNDYSTYLTALGGLTGANTNITNLTTGLTGTNTNLSGNVAIFTGAFTGSNTRLSGAESNVIALQGGLSGSNTNITNLTTGLTGANTNITLRATLANPTFTGVVNIPNLTLTAAGGIEGGQLDLANAITNTTITTGIAIDIYGDKVRIFEKGGTNRGAYLDLSAASVGIGSNLLAGSSNTVSEPISYIVQSYVTSSINTYPIGTTVSSVGNVSVYLNGVYQNKNQYVLSNSSSNVQFTDTTLPTSLSLEIVTIGAPTILSSHIVQSYVTSSINTYPIGVTVSSVNNVFVHLNGVYQNKNQYVLSNSSSNVQFTDATLTSSLSLEIITIR